MRCSEFRDLHCAFIDDTLAGVELVRMQRHIAECPECAARDTKVRRSLMVVRSLPPIEPSPDFAARLDRRLRSCATEEQHAGASFRTVASVGLVMSAAMLLYLAEALHVGGVAPHARDIVLPPVIAMATPPADATPATLASDSASSNSARVIVASVGAGVPIWPVAALVEQPSLQLVSYTQGH